TVDGAAAPILRANLMFRAVALAPGTHEIIFSYEPVAWRTGAAISLAALAVLALVCVASVIPRLGAFDVGSSLRAESGVLSGVQRSRRIAGWSEAISPSRGLLRPKGCCAIANDAPRNDCPKGETHLSPIGLWR
ncbi:MAG: hypothetical protein QG637_388, partial [Chloroflexota bacterium]|nr:hypothetical protein [Chloroflexota bacterium]